MRKYKLSVAWSKKEKDLLFRFPRKADGNLLMYRLCTEIFTNHLGKPPTFEKSFVDELKERGYDIKTLKFSISRSKKAVIAEEKEIAKHNAHVEEECKKSGRTPYILR